MYCWNSEKHDDPYFELNTFWNLLLSSLFYIYSVDRCCLHTPVFVCIFVYLCIFGELARQLALKSQPAAMQNPEIKIHTLEAT